MTRETRHVVRHPDGGWIVKKGGSDHVAKIYKTQKEAISRGIEISRKKGAELYIHRRDGLIREKNSYRTYRELSHESHHYSSRSL